MHETNYPLIGVGLYTVPEASRLTGVSPARIRRWIKGYTYKVGESTRESNPVWRTQLPIIDDTVALGFQDLMEVRFIDAFREHGVSWGRIRLAAQRAQSLFKYDHPFSMRRFQTDGRTIFAEIADGSREMALLDLIKSQYAFKRVVSPSLVAGLEFSSNDSVVRWWPMGKSSSIVLDPQRGFGQPIDSKFGVPTVNLSNAYLAEKSYDKVARWYDVSEKAVRDAVKYERKLAA